MKNINSIALDILEDSPRSSKFPSLPLTIGWTLRFSGMPRQPSRERECRASPQVPNMSSRLLCVNCLLQKFRRENAPSLPIVQILRFPQNYETIFRASRKPRSQHRLNKSSSSTPITVTLRERLSRVTGRSLR